MKAKINRSFFLVLGLFSFQLSYSQGTMYNDSIHFEGEKHFANLRQLTFGGDNAEAYFSPDGKYLVYQYTNPKKGIECDQIWMGKIPQKPGETFNPKLVSSGTGRTTCAYFYPDGKHILYGSTHLGGKECPRFPTVKSMETNTYGLCILLMIFLKPIPTETS